MRSAVSSGARKILSIAAGVTVATIEAAAGVEVLYDDRDARPGVKFADDELLARRRLARRLGRASARALNGRARGRRQRQQLLLDQVRGADDTAPGGGGLLAALAAARRLLRGGGPAFMVIADALSLRSASRSAGARHWSCSSPFP